MAKKIIKKSNPIGRPSKYNPDNLPDMSQIINVLMSQGACKLEVAVALGICKDTLNEWCKEYPAFSAAIKRGVELSEVWWRRKGRENVDSKEFNSTLWYMNMKNRFKWADKVETTGTITVKQEDAIKDLE